MKGALLCPQTGGGRVYKACCSSWCAMHVDKCTAWGETHIDACDAEARSTSKPTKLDYPRCTPLEHRNSNLNSPKVFMYLASSRRINLTNSIAIPMIHVHIDSGGKYTYTCNIILNFQPSSQRSLSGLQVDLLPVSHIMRCTIPLDERKKRDGLTSYTNVCCHAVLLWV